MALILRDCTFFGPALPEPFVLTQLEAELNKRRLLPKHSGDEGRALQEAWESFRRKLRELGEQGGDRRVLNHVLEPLSNYFGYAAIEAQGSVITREGAEDGGLLLTAPEGQKLRAWTTALGTDLDAPNRRGRAYRFSPSRVAQRVLLACGERAGLLTDGEELRLLICDPARPDSHISFDLSRAGGWRSPQWARTVPDSYRLLRALASPGGIAALPELTNDARLAQSQVTKKLRVQARRAIEGFLQEVLDHPSNQADLTEAGSSELLAKELWREGLILVYRLLFVFKLETSPDPARAFSFASAPLWRGTYSPNLALAEVVRKVLDNGSDTGSFLESGLRALWRMFSGGMSSNELEIKPLGGMLFGEGTTPLLDQFQWGERAVAKLLDALLWTSGDGRNERERVHYGALDVEDLGRVYEALLELEPGITTQPMCRLRRAKLEVVVPVAQGAAYRTNAPAVDLDELAEEPDEVIEDEENAEEDETPKRGGKAGKTQVLFIEEIPAGRFFLRVGLGRKATGSYYTPHPFVRFLVQETLGPQLAERSPKEDPHPGKILELKVIDPAMGSGHFLVEACRYLGEALYEACRLCDELAVQAEEEAEKLKEAERAPLLAHATELRKRVEDLPDPNDELVAYLPSRVPEGEASGLSQKKAEALCRRLVAVHCLYGVDKNPLAVELAKLSLWLESYAEGLPLTFMDHRLICGDSLTGPFFEHLLTYPGSGAKLDDLYTQGLTAQLQETLAKALVHARDLEASVGKDVADLEHKRGAKEKLDEALKPLKLLAAAWSGGVMLGDACDDAGYQTLAQAVGKAEDVKQLLDSSPKLQEMVEVGKESVSFELAFAEVFHPSRGERLGFNAVLGNPPWDAIRRSNPQFFGGFDISYLTLEGTVERKNIQSKLLSRPNIASAYQNYLENFRRQDRISTRLFKCHTARVYGNLAGRGTYDTYMLLCERSMFLLVMGGRLGVILPGSFHINEGATGIRRLLIRENELQILFGFQNKRSLFDIVTNVKFDLIVARRITEAHRAPIECSFYILEASWLFSGRDNESMKYSVKFIEQTGGEYLSFIELKNKIDTQTAAQCGSAGIEFRELTKSLGIEIGGELNMTYDGGHLQAVSDVLPTSSDPRDPDVLGSILNRGLWVVSEDDSFHQYDDHWTGRPQYVVDPVSTGKKHFWLRPSCFYRVMLRRIATVVDTRSLMACIVPPGWISACPQASRNAGNSPIWAELALTAVLNSYPMDWSFRLRVAATVNLFLLRSSIAPRIANVRKFLSHQALRLSSNHSSYTLLWTEQLGDAWREPKPKHSWPVLDGDDIRWSVRATIDAVVADAYGLDREQYAHVLSTFSHKSYPKAPELCLAAFDELKLIGLEAFTQKYDPYWDIPLNESLPKPVIDLPIPSEATPPQSSLGPLFDGIEDMPDVTPASAPLKLSTRPLPSAPDGAYDALLRLLNDRGVITSGDAQEATGLDTGGVRPFLKRLVDEGHAVTEGQRRGMKYRRRSDD